MEGDVWGQPWRRRVSERTPTLTPRSVRIHVRHRGEPTLLAVVSKSTGTAVAAQVFSIEGSAAASGVVRAKAQQLADLRVHRLLATQTSHCVINFAGVELHRQK